MQARRPSTRLPRPGPCLALFSDELPCLCLALGRASRGQSRVCLHCVLNLAGAGASHSKSNYHLSEEKAGPGIHSLGRALCAATEGWKRPSPPRTPGLPLVMAGEGGNGHSRPEVVGQSWRTVGSGKEGSLTARGASSLGASTVALDKAVVSIGHTDATWMYPRMHRASSRMRFHFSRTSPHTRKLWKENEYLQEVFLSPRAERAACGSEEQRDLQLQFLI